jgi:hypothetical protein
MKTKLTLRWEREDGNHLEETWERENDGKLYEMFLSLTGFILSMGKIVGEKK